MVDRSLKEDTESCHRLQLKTEREKSITTHGSHRRPIKPRFSRAKKKRTCYRTVRGCAVAWNESEKEVEWKAPLNSPRVRVTAPSTYMYSVRIRTSRTSPLGILAISSSYFHLLIRPKDEQDDDDSKPDSRDIDLFSAQTNKARSGNQTSETKYWQTNGRSICDVWFRFFFSAHAADVLPLICMNC